MTTFTGDRTIHMAASMKFDRTLNHHSHAGNVHTVNIFRYMVSLKAKRRMKPTFTVIFRITAISEQNKITEY
jgi:hypothetical protein